MKNTSGKENWYTPVYILDKARDTLGTIDLDPASSEEANKRVRAKYFFDKETNGLEQPWFGKVWLNPPYGRSVCEQFVHRMIAHGDGLLLTNSSTDTKWWQAAASAASAMCLPNNRIAFIDGDTGLVWNGNRFSQTIFCFGDQYLQKFYTQFGDCGVIVTRVNK